MSSVAESALRTRSEDFSLVQGGPLFQLLRRSQLVDDALGHVPQRILAISLFCWLPLLVLSIIEGNALGGRTAVPFLLDAEVYTRFLVATPLLIAAEVIVHRRLRFVVKQFADRQLIPTSGMAQFEAAIAKAFRLRNSAFAEVLLFAFVYVVGILIVWRHYIAIDTATWYASRSADAVRLSIAGTWLGYVSLPIFQFLLCRWYFRMFIWARFLWHVSRIDLSLVPTHPDRVGGLGFLSNTVYAFVPLLLAHGALLSGVIGNRIYHLNARLNDFTLEIFVLVAFLICVVVGPLCVFAFRIAHTKRMALREYGTVAERYARDFGAKWLRRDGLGPSSGDGIDVRYLAELRNSFELVRTMKIVPVSKQTIIQLVVAAVLPTAPLLLTVIPFEELLKRLVGILV